MSSALRYVKEPSSTRREFIVHSYYGVPTESADYFFTVEGDSLYRIENDLSNVHWVVARDMGAQRVINSIDPEILEFWQNKRIRILHPHETLPILQSAPKERTGKRPECTAVRLQA